ncbi:MAG: RNase adapter RapZ [Actinomycetota bacterium]|nr:RNase adapter RapZ [Actinomycetota bacterium]
MADAGSSFDVLLVTGMSGAGRSTAARALEDAGWFVIDNIPPMLLGAAIEVAEDNPDVQRVAVVVDARGGSFFPQLAEAMEGLRSSGVNLRVLFLEASEESLVRRFESSRRPHPLQEGARILDGLRKERLVLGDLRSRADLVIDTTSMNVHELRRAIDSAFADSDERLNITVMSFGFKHGIPVDADMVADARFLPNPYWDERLRDRTGQDPQVAQAVLTGEGAQEFLEHLAALVRTTRDGYLREGKRFVTVAVGCTGGKHRSVALSEELASTLDAPNVRIGIEHRDLGKE